MATKSSRRRSASRRDQKRAERRKRQSVSSAKPGFTHYLRQFTSQRHLRREVFERIKSSPMPVMRAVLHEIVESELPHLVGNPFPQTLSELFSQPPIPLAPARAELAWNTEVVCFHAERLNSYLSKRRVFERHLLSGAYVEAVDSLGQIIDSHGHSLWTINAGLTTSQLSGGLTGNREYLAVASAQLIHAFDRVLAQFFSQRAERTLSSTTYFASVDDFCERHGGSSEATMTLDYVRFKLAFPALNEPPKLSHALYVDSLHPVPDRYESVIRCLQIKVATNATSAGDIECIRRLASSVDDVRCKVLAFAIGDDLEDAAERPASILSGAVDLYTVGRYAEVLEHCRVAMLEAPDCFELYELYCLSALQLNAALEPVFATGSLADQILQTVFSLMSRDERTPESLENLLNLSSVLDGSRLGAQLLAFLIPLTSRLRWLASDKFRALNATAMTPLMTHILAPESDVYVNSSDRSRPSAKLFRAVRSAPRALDELTELIPAPRLAKYRASALKARGDYLAAARILRELHNEPDGNVPMAEVVIRELLSVLLKAERTSDALDLIVNTYLSNKFLLLGLPLSDLADRYDEQVDAGDINWPIFFHLMSQLISGKFDRRRVYEAYDAFLSARAATRPGDTNVTSGVTRERLAAFYRDVCTMDVLDCSVVFSSTDELEAERILLCQRLIALAPESAESFSQEIARLTQNTMVRQAITHIGDSKVHVDVGGIKRSLDSSFRERYDRHMSFRGLADKLRQAIEMEGLSLDADKIIIVSDASVAQFEELFRELRTRFISSNEFGLDSYLSVRIRHGTLSGQIRSQFEKENLITRRQGADGPYGRNVYWAEREFSSRGRVVQEAADHSLRSFSSEVDQIIEKIKKEWIQIKSSHNPSGLFDFDYSPADIADLHFRTVRRKSFDEFIDTIFDELWSRTRRNLERVNEKISIDLNRLLSRALDDLSARMSSLDETLRRSTFADAVARCRTNIRNELGTIAAWFRLTDEHRTADFHVQLLADTAMQIVKNCYPTVGFSGHVNVTDEKFLIDGTFLTPLVDVVFILLDNVVKHGNALDPQVHIGVEPVSKYLTIDVRNGVPSNFELAELKSRLAQISNVESPKDGDAVRREGGSGFAKLRKLLRHDLGRGDSFRIEAQVIDDAQVRVKVSFATEGMWIDANPNC